MKKFIDFLKSVNVELHKVSWLKSKELMKHTFIVIAFTLVMMIFFALADFGISQIAKFIF